MNDNSLTVSPIAKKISLTPGETFDSSLRITNASSSKSPLHFKVSVAPYGVLGEDYLVDLSTVTAYTRILDWITIDNPEGNVEPGKSAFVNYHISVPADATSGGQYCALVVQNIPAEEETATSAMTINNILEISSLIYAQLGNSTYSGEVLESKIPTISFEPTLNTSVKIKNTGNIHQNARITTKAFSAFTGKQIPLASSDAENELAGVTNDETLAEYGADYYSEIIMPETTRQSFHKVSGFPSLGVFKVTQEVSFNGQVSTSEQTAIICPVWFICLCLVALGSFITLLACFIKKSKNRKNRYSKNL